ncbi:MAG: hypothetical protein O2954_05750 [bacterium]|nr:hypothetical protein [bacterium]
MTVQELIDFYLSIRRPGGLLGFDSVFEEELEALKAAIQAHYGDQEAWVQLPEDAELPEGITQRAEELVEKYEAWNRGADQ